jgi:uncharacterized protein YebE (UPF0316 family)
MTSGQPVDRLTVIVTVVALAALWTSLWDPWKELAESFGWGIGVIVLIFFIPVVIALGWTLNWLRTH